MSLLNGWFADRAPKLRGVGSGYAAPFDPGGAVGFNGSTMLYNLPHPTDNANWSMVAWVKFGTIGGGITPSTTQGAFFRMNTQNDGTKRFVQCTPNMTDGTITGLGIRVDDDHSFNGGGASAFGTGWIQMFASCKMVNIGGDNVTVTRVIYLDDTEIINDAATDVWGPDPLFQYSLADSTDGSGLHAHAIGAKYLDDLTTGDTDNTPPTPSGTGLKCGMGPCWMDRRFVDWSDVTNRDKFRAYVAGAYHPRAIGADGSTPFGTAPWIYLLGNSATFATNLGSGGGTLTVSGTLVDITGPS